MLVVIMLHPRGYVDLPAWAQCLSAPYWRIRVEGRNKALRRKYYRQVKKIKLQLVEAGHDQLLVELICRYLSTFSVSSAMAVNDRILESKRQMRLF